MLRVVLVARCTICMWCRGFEGTVVFTPNTQQCNHLSSKQLLKMMFIGAAIALALCVVACFQSVRIALG